MPVCLDQRLRCRTWPYMYSSRRASSTPDLQDERRYLVQQNVFFHVDKHFLAKSAKPHTP